MAQIRYLAALSEDPDQLARFYGSYFGMTELGRSNEGDVSLTDGHYNFSVLKKRQELKEPRNEIGLHHIGLQVESIRDVRDRYLKFSPRGTIVPEPDDLHHGEVRIYDPEMNPVTLSERPFGVGAEDCRYPRIVHIAFDAMLPENIMTFYCDVLGLREVESSFTTVRAASSTGSAATAGQISPFTRSIRTQWATRDGSVFSISAFWSTI